MAMQEELVGRHLARLGDADSEGRRAAMHSLKAFVEQLDSGTMPAFLQQVSPSRGAGLASPQSRSYAISLYEEVARAHGKLIVPHIGRVMTTVTRSLASGTGSSPQLHQACARVVAAVARHAIDPAAPAAEGETILRGLCQPLLEALVADPEHLAAGAALCLQALVESEKWKHAGMDMVQQLCSIVSTGLQERGGRGLAHLQLARSLVMTCGSSAAHFAEPLLCAASQILLTGMDGAWQPRVCAARLVQAVLWRVDKRKLNGEEVAGALEALDICSRDRSSHVRAAAIEALHSASMRVDEDDNRARRLSNRRMLGDRNGRHNGMSPFSTEVAADPPSGPEGYPHDPPWSAERRPQKADRSVDPAMDSIWMKVDRADDTFAEETAFGYEDRRPSDASDNVSAVGSPMHLSGYGTGDEYYGDYIFRTAEQGTSNPSPVSMVTSELLTGASTNSTVTFQLQGEDQPPEMLGADGTYVPFTTPRRLLRSLISDGDTASNGAPRLGDGSDATHLDMETCSNSSWSVRNNPIATEGALGPDGKEDGALEAIPEAQQSAMLDRCNRTVTKDPLPSSAPTDRVDIPREGTVAPKLHFPSPSLEVPSLRNQEPNVSCARPDDVKRMTVIASSSVMGRKSLQVAKGLVEMLLGGSLCAMVALPVAIAISRVMESHSYTVGMLVPT